MPKKYQIEDWENRNLYNTETKTLIEKIETHRRLLETMNIDEERSIMGRRHPAEKMFFGRRMEH